MCKSKQIKMASANANQDDLVSDIIKKVAAFDIRKLGPYPETKEGFKRAAVLLPITVCNGEVLILLTKRSKYLRSHPSATAFPGGNRDETDTSDITTALREAEEEIGLPPDTVQVLGILTRGITWPNTVVYPVVGLIPSDFVPTVNPSEVEFAFYMPLKDFISEDKVSVYAYDIQGQSFLFRSIIYSNGDVTEKVWGFTASYCILLAKIIFGDLGHFQILANSRENQNRGLYDGLEKYFEYISSLALTTSNLKMTLSLFCNLGTS
uniref:Nudix hydrolase domain-containing protein n=1 Tax=Arion vulgaris TaxID=1028688 RepID=A0A0B6ZSK8_9EUPU